MRRLCATMLLLLSLGACAKKINSNIQSYSAIPANAYVGKTITIISPYPNVQATLEFQTISSILAEKFKQKGMVILPTERAGEADYIAAFAYGVDNGHLENSISSMPVFGQTGYSGANTSGMISSYGGTSTYSGTTTYKPTYGITG